MQNTEASKKRCIISLLHHTEANHITERIETHGTSRLINFECSDFSDVIYD
jgi:hypothetical protein